MTITDWRRKGIARQIEPKEVDIAKVDRQETNGVVHINDLRVVDLSRWMELMYGSEEFDPVSLLRYSSAKSFADIVGNSSKYISIITLENNVDLTNEGLPSLNVTGDSGVVIQGTAGKLP